MGISEFEVIKAAKFNSFDIVIAFNVPSLSCTAAQKLHFWQKLLWKNILSYCRCMSKDISHKMNASLWSAVAKHFFTYSRLLNFGRFHLVIFTYPFLLYIFCHGFAYMYLVWAHATTAWGILLISTYPSATVICIWFERSPALTHSYVRIFQYNFSFGFIEI